MIVTFRSEAYADIMMFGEIAIQLLKLMGHSGTVPGALLAEDVPEALANLKKAITDDKARVAAPPGIPAGVPPGTLVAALVLAGTPVPRARPRSRCPRPA